MNILHSFAFGLAFLSLWSRWFKSLSNFWFIPVILSVIVATTTSLISGIALASAVSVITLAIIIDKYAVVHPAMTKFLKVLLILLCLVLALHIVPGFHNINIAHDAIIKYHSVPYSLWLNYDKILAGTVLTVCFIDVAHVTTAFQRILSWTIAGTLGSSLLTMAPSLAFGMIAWDPGIPYLFISWALSNLLITSMTEEVFFRGILQFQLEKLLHSYRLTLASALAVLATAILFGAAHLTGGVFYVLTATGAGLFYGLVYVKTRRIETAVLTHFLTNCVHILLFSYPRLA